MLANSTKIFSIFLIVILLSSISPSYFQNYHNESNSDNIQPAFAQVASNEIRQIGNYALYGLQSVNLEQNVTISSGNVGVHSASPNMQLTANAEIKIKKDSKFTDPNSAVVGDSIIIEQGVTAQNIFYNELQNSGTILGSQNSPLQLPLVDSLPIFLHSTPNTNAITVPKDSSLTLPAGVYGAIFVDERGTLNLSGGIYNVTSVTAKKDSKILFNSKSDIIVQNYINWQKGIQVGPSTSSSIKASDIVFFVGSDSTINQNSTTTDFGNNAVIDANIYAPNGKITMEKGTIATGAFIANVLDIKQDSRIARDSAFGITKITPPIDVTALKAYYKFDELSGALINLSPSTDSLGSTANGVADSTIIRGIAGIINNAYQWNGINSKVRVGNSNTLFNFLHNSNALWTINVWYKLNDVDGPFTFIASDASSDSTNRGLELSLDPVADIFTLRIRNFGEVALVNSNIQVPEDINWHMLTVTYDQNAASGNHTQFVLDGNVANKDVRDKAGTKAPPSAADTLLHFGSRESATSPTIFNGRMDEYTIWNRILADNEIVALYHNGAGLDLGSSGNAAPGGPYFSLELNHTSVNATRPSTVIVPLQVNWQEEYPAEPVTVDVIGINATSITYSVTSTYNSTSYQLFDIVFDIPADVQAAGYQFLISVKEVESNDTVGTAVTLNVQ